MRESKSMSCTRSIHAWHCRAGKPTDPQERTHNRPPHVVTGDPTETGDTPPHLKPDASDYE